MRCSCVVFLEVLFLKQIFLERCCFVRFLPCFLSSVVFLILSRCCLDFVVVC